MPLSARSWLKIAIVPSLFLGLSLLHDSHASAQSPAAGATPVATPILMAADLKKVPIGSWAQYRASDGGGNSLSIKMTLVGRSGKVAELETTVEGGPLAALGKTTIRTSIFTDTGDDAKPGEHVLQVGASAPMLIPAGMGGAQAQSFKKPDPKEKIGVDQVVVPAGTFAKAEHFRSSKKNGEPVDSWVSRDVPPFGLVKMTAGTGGAGQAMQMELVAHGAGANRSITATPEPFNPAALMKLLQPVMAPRAGLPQKPGDGAPGVRLGTGSGPGSPPGSGSRSAN